MPKRNTDAIRGQRQRQRAKQNQNATPGTQSWRLQMMQMFPARTFEEAEADPGFRHVGDVEGIVLRADYGSSGMGTAYIQVTGPHVLALMEACASSNSGQMLHMRLYTCDEDPQWMEHWNEMQSEAD
jgi:hypothetical protein